MGSLEKRISQVAFLRCQDLFLSFGSWKKTTFGSSTPWCWLKNLPVLQIFPYISRNFWSKTDVCPSVFVAPIMSRQWAIPDPKWELRFSMEFYESTQAMITDQNSPSWPMCGFQPSLAIGFKQHNGFQPLPGIVHPISALCFCKPLEKTNTLENQRLNFQLWRCIIFWNGSSKRDQQTNLFDFVCHDGSGDFSTVRFSSKVLISIDRLPRRFIVLGKTTTSTPTANKKWPLLFKPRL